jgi:hypothetical protein
LQLHQLAHHFARLRTTLSLPAPRTDGRLTSKLSPACLRRSWGWERTRCGKRCGVNGATRYADCAFVCCADWSSVSCRCFPALGRYTPSHTARIATSISRALSGGWRRCQQLTFWLARGRSMCRCLPSCVSATYSLFTALRRGLAALSHFAFHSFCSTVCDPSKLILVSTVGPPSLVRSSLHSLCGFRQRSCTQRTRRRGRRRCFLVGCRWRAVFCVWCTRGCHPPSQHRRCLAASSLPHSQPLWLGSVSSQIRRLPHSWCCGMNSLTH